MDALHVTALVLLMPGFVIVMWAVVGTVIGIHEAVGAETDSTHIGA